MSNKKNKKDKEAKQSRLSVPKLGVGQETKRSILGILAFVLAALFGAAPLGFGGVAGTTLHSWFVSLFGVGYYLLPIALAFLGFGLFRGAATEGEPIGHGKTIGAAVLFLAGTAILSITIDRGGIVGGWVALPFSLLFDYIFGTIILSAIAIIGALIALDTPLVLPRFMMPAFLQRKQVVGVSENVTLINPDKEPTVQSWNDEAPVEPAPPERVMQQPLK
ncbi:MAG: cell division protein ftsK, segregation ATPase FtsK/SpoIIIE, family, partial [Candidatus Parcubacteria bacterium]